MECSVTQRILLQKTDVFYTQPCAQSKFQKKQTRRDRPRTKRLQASKYSLEVKIRRFGNVATENITMPINIKYFCSLKVILSKKMVHKKATITIFGSVSTDRPFKRVMQCL